MTPAVLGIDLGGTRTRAAIVGDDGTVLDRESIVTDRSLARPAPLVELARRLLAGGPPVDHAVVGLPGRIDHRAGRLETAANIPASWMPWLDEDRLGEALGLPVLLANDADLAAVGEARFGAGSGRADVAYLTVSTGIGAGVLLGNRLVRGRWSCLEIGHTVIDRTALAQGRRDFTLERQGSGTALERLAAAAGLALRGPEITRLAEAGDAVASRLLDEVAEAVTIGVVNLAWLFSPEVVVVGGGLGLIGERLLGPVRRGLERFGPPMREGIEVVNAALGDDSALAGAAGWRTALAP